MIPDWQKAVIVLGTSAGWVLFDLLRQAWKRRRARLDVWIEWVEPYGPSDAPMICRVRPETAVAVMRRLHPDVYQNDKDALEEFIVVHWADVVRVQSRKAVE